MEISPQKVPSDRLIFAVSKQEPYYIRPIWRGFKPWKTESYGLGVGERRGIKMAEQDAQQDKEDTELHIGEGLVAFTQVENAKEFGDHVSGSRWEYFRLQLGGNVIRTGDSVIAELEKQVGNW